ncbi:DoxX family protein [Streptomyces broussonetiae]|uniref:DoxX family protein n=1 Tax=Streptomyces broussonetiae TaxID=2686304 RepID=A0A6I6MTZ6_9ACTN|nr:DoxX family protein [Streptomyces broussonetiae]QHA02494.1 DoxX family protein [Streptomyces broussonetiae]
MHVAYWITAGLLAMFYLCSGGLKLLRTSEQLRPMMAWVDSLPMPVVRALGAVEVLGSLGLILPPVTGIRRWLALAAAIGFVVLQIGATRVHVSRGDRRIALNLVLFCVAVVTMWLSTSWL